MSSDQFDPQAVDDSPGRSQYMSLKDIKVLAIVFVGLTAAIFPIYKSMERRSEKARCSQNVKAIMDALNLYANEHDNRYPPLARMDPSTGEPSPGPAGHPYTWVSDISPFFIKRASFVCPTATPAEIAQTEDPNSSKKTIGVTYGMYSGLSCASISGISNPDQVTVIAETSNHGSMGSLDPHPFGGGQMDDAFAIGWDDSNLMPTTATKHVTRLAFQEVEKNQFKETGAARHDEGIHALTVTGQRYLMKPNQSRVIYMNGQIVGAWSLPAEFKSTKGE